MIRILGIDPGSQRTGIGVIDVAADGKSTHVFHTTINLLDNDSFHMRLRQVFEAVGEVIVSVVAWSGELYASGSFTSSNGLALNNVARFDGANWQPLLTGCDGPVYSLRAYPDGLYAAGWFTYADTVEANGLAR